VLHQGTLQGRQTTDKSKVLLPTSSKAASSVRWTVSLFNDASSHLLTDRNKCPYYYSIITHTTNSGFTVLSKTPKTNSSTASLQNHTAQYNTVFIQMCSYMTPKCSVNFLTSQTCVGPCRAFYQNVKTFIKRRMHSVIQLCPGGGKLYDPVHVRYVRTHQIYDGYVSNI
jgi:hypothetical protein